MLTYDSIDLKLTSRVCLVRWLLFCLFSLFIHYGFCVQTKCEDTTQNPNDSCNIFFFFCLNLWHMSLKRIVAIQCDADKRVRCGKELI